jgi:hypothetical protein
MDRLTELQSYHILDTSPEKEFDDLAILAAAICETPVSLISFIDDTRQWYKSKIGLTEAEVPIAETFCQYTLDNPNELLLVTDPKQEERFQNNPSVLKEGGIAFYAGAPLVSPRGNVIGTVCVIDYKTRQMSELQKKALSIIANKTMRFLEQRKTILLQKNEIDYNVISLSRLTDMVPGYLFKLIKNPKSDLSVAYVSAGMQRLTNEISREDVRERPMNFLKHIYKEDRLGLITSIKHAVGNQTSIDFEYRLASEPTIWHGMKANCKSLPDGSIAWYGIVQNVSQKKAHEAVLHKVLFDISHIVRRPVANIKGLINLLDLSLSESSEVADLLVMLKESSMELDQDLSVLNNDYDLLRNQLFEELHLHD